MDPVETGKAALISGIETDARAEEQRIIADAETQAAEKKQYAQKKADAILDEAREKAREQAEAIKRKMMSGVELEIKRRSLRIRDTLVRDVMSRVEKKLGTLIGQPSYRAILIDWIVEAAIGLDVDAAQVNASAQERTGLNDALLAEAREAIEGRTGKQVALTMAQTPPLESQGVVLTTVDGRMAFNNQVRTRMARKQREIQLLIYQAVFAGRSEE